MNDAIKIVCLGGGSLYFRRVLGYLALEGELSGSEVVLYDIDAEKAERMAALGNRLASESGTELKVRACAELDEAVDGADSPSPPSAAAGRKSRVMSTTRAITAPTCTSPPNMESTR